MIQETDNRFFGKELWSKMSFRKSAMIMCISCLIFHMALLVLATIANVTYDPNDSGGNINFALIAIFTSPIMFMINFIPDYFSVFYTRWLLSLIKESSCIIVVIILSIADLVGSLCIGLLTFIPAMAAAMIWESTVSLLGYRFGVTYGIISAWWVIGVFSTMTSLLTSVWIWLFCAGWVIIYVLRVMGFTIFLFRTALTPVAYGFLLLGVLGMPFFL